MLPKYLMRLIFFVGLVLFVQLFVVRSGLGGEPGTSPSPVAMAQIRSLVQTQNANLTGLRVEYRSWFLQNYGSDRYEHYIVAAKGTQRYAYLWHGEFPSRENDPRAFIQIFDGKNWNVFSPYFRKYDVSQKFAIRPYTDKILLHPFFESLSWWPPDDPNVPPRKIGRGRFVLDVINDKECVVVGRQPIEDHWCHVIEIPGADRFWVDCTLGLIRRHVVFEPEGEHRKIITLESSDFRMANPNIILPYRFRRIIHVLNTEVISLVDDYDLSEKNLLDKNFHLDVPPGTLIHDRDTDRLSQIPGGFEIMDRLVSWTRTSGMKALPSRFGIKFGAFISCMAGFFVGFLLWRKLKFLDFSFGMRKAA